MSQFTTNRLMTDGFSTIQTPSGTYPVAGSPSDILTFTSSDGSVIITGNAVTDSIDFTVSPSGAGFAFGTIVPDFGTSPVADTASDTLTLITDNPSAYAFTGNATTDTITFSAPGLLLTSTFNDYNLLQKEPTGFPNRTDSTMSINTSTRTFTIQPTTTSYDFYVKGVKFTKTASLSSTWPALPGTHYFYFDISGNLQTTQVFNSAIITDNAFISVLYWNTDNNTAPYYGEERHGLVMDGETHAYLHTTFGARFISGGALQNFNVNGSGSLAIDAQFTSDSGSIRDEDILHQYLAQTQIPILYQQGVLWRKKAADAYPVIYSGTAGYTGALGLLAYNQLSGGSWSLQQVPNNNFVLVHIFATNDINNPVVGIQGINTYNDISAARLGALSEITTLSGLPFAEFVALGSVVFQTASSYSNIPKARVRSVNGGNYVDFRGTQPYTPAAGVATSHSLLSNLSNDDHLQYLTDARGDVRYYTKSQTYTKEETNLVSIVNSLIFG